MTELKQITTRLRDAINGSGYSLSQISQMTDIPKSTLQRWTSGQIKKVPVDEIVAIADAIGTSAKWIMGWGDDTPIPADIMPPPKTRRIPILGTIACGTPIEAIQNYDGEAFVPEDVRCDFALRCKGDSMKDARINDGDLVYIRAQPQVESGQIAAVLIDGEATLKRVYYHPGSVVLMPANPAYDPIVLDPATADPDSVRVLGLAVAFTSVIV